jgi:L-cysteine:1D-myo-inositol 2-amino-2-deoxy-alpha-D-glucopyranoside ligase
MDAWPAPEVPLLPGSGPAVRLHDTATRELCHTGTGQAARLYVCGITPYDATHLGHAATYIAFDLLQRVWRDSGRAVRYVQNVTDVDDPLLERAARTGEAWHELAQREIERYRDDMIALRVVPPARYVGAVEAIPRIVQVIDALRARGATYDLDGDLYLPVAADPRFGEVTRLDAARMVSLFRERGGDPDRPGKKDPLDQLLWQAQRPGEPGWDSPFGRGRPGWHVECTAIALEHLGMSFEVQGGGSDLAFPHHEMGAAAAHVLTGEEPFAQVYVHAGMVGLAGHKMSKSRGNLVFVSALRRAGVDPMAIRLALLEHHYRSDWEWTEAEIPRAEGRLARWRQAVSHPDGPSGDEPLAAVRAALADDLDAPRALAAVDRWVVRQHDRGGSDPAGPGVVSRAVDALLGIAL